MLDYNLEAKNLISFLNYLLENFILNLLFIVILTLALLLPILNFFIFSSLKMCFIKNPYKDLKKLHRKLKEKICYLN